MSEQRNRTHARMWLAGVAMTGVSALVLAAGILWTLVSTPSAVAGAETPTIALVFGRWAWHLVQLVAAWM